MNKPLASFLALSALLAAPMGAHAITYTFNAAINGTSEVPTNALTATGIAILAYDNNNTATLTDDTYDFSMAVFGLTGGSVAGTAASDFHIHGAATVTENAPVRVSLNSAAFAKSNSGSTLLVGGSGVAAPTALFTTAPSATNGGHAAMSFLDMLRNGLAYVNVHTALNPAGAVRGQLIEVSAVPEPSTYALLLAGLGMVGMAARRRSQVGR